MRALLLAAALAGLALAPFAVPTAEATRCNFVIEELAWVVCAPIFLVLCAGQWMIDGGNPKYLLLCALNLIP